MKLLLHSCCAPCSIKCVEALRYEGIEPTLFWYNPNIHPLKEYKNRKNALTEYARKIKAKLITEENYGLRQFISDTYPDFNNRCSYCYESRIFKTAQFASENGFDSFSTTLLISPYQNHELICKLAEKAEEKFNVKFLYRDFRPFFKEGQQAARDMEIYMQKYCGCIFSEEDRYTKKPKKAK